MGFRKPVVIFIFILSLSDSIYANQYLRSGLSSLIWMSQNSCSLVSGGSASLRAGKWLVARGEGCCSELSHIYLRQSREFHTSLEGPRVPDGQIILLDYDTDKQLIDWYHSWRTFDEIIPGTPADLIQDGRLALQTLPFSEVPYSSVLVPPKYAPIVLDVLAHGSECGRFIQVNTLPFDLGSPLKRFGSKNDAVWSARDLAQFLHHHPVYHEAVERAGPNLVIRLISCCTARPKAYPVSFAQSLSGQLQQMVFAPTNILWLGKPPYYNLLVSPNGIQGFFPFGTNEADYRWRLFNPH